MFFFKQALCLADITHRVLAVNFYTANTSVLCSEEFEIEISFIKLPYLLNPV